MKKIIFGIFAHPDDEAFGPSGTLLMETNAGSELHLITLTAGDAGMNVDNHADLAAVRLEEWQQAGKLLGATSMTCFGYKDGMLSNRSMLEISQKIIDHIATVLTDITSDCDIELMSMDLNGISGHIDHIVAGRASSYAFYTLKATDARFSRIRLACIPFSRLPEPNTNWLFMEAGRTDEEIGEVVDARHLRSDILEIMQTHHTQRHDYQTHVKQSGDMLGMNYFLVRT